MDNKINKGGRPFKDDVDKRSKVVKINFTNKEYLELIKKKPANMSDSHFFLQIILSKKEDLTDLQNYYPLLMSINKVGNNINQIAKKLNSFGKLSDADIKYFFEKHNQFISDMNSFFEEKK